MPPSTRPAAARDRAAARTLPDRRFVLALCVVGWLIPGAAHFLQGQTRKGLVFFVTLIGMFAFGVGAGGRIFPLQMSDPLVFLAAAAEWLLGLPRLVAWLGGFGAGDVVRAAYEYGNTFLIAAGLLNALVLLDAFDLASGRKAQS